jgi:membrane protein
MAGRKADKPGAFSWRGWWQNVKYAIRAYGRHDMPTTAAAISFLAVFGLFSAFSAFVAFYALVADPKTVVSDMGQLHGFTPTDVVLTMVRQMHSIVGHSTTTLFSIGVFSFVVALWCAQQGISTLMVALNTAYLEQMTYSSLNHLLKSLFIAIEVIGGLVVASVLAIGLPEFTRAMGQSLWIAQFVRAGGMVSAGFLLFFGLTALYHWVPDRHPARWRWSSAGAALVVGFWIIASILFSVFLAYSNSYNAMYGSLSGVVLLLTLTYVTVVTVLLGAEFNAQLEYHINIDTTTGGPHPIGERGAYVADHTADEDARKPASKSNSKWSDSAGEQSRGSKD